MPLILAIEPDRHQAAQLAAIAQGRIGAELVLAESADRALRALGNRVPDLILTPQLLSPRDDAAITDRLRALGTAATFVQTLTIPALETAQPGTASRTRGLLSALRRQKAAAPAANGCAPDVFAEQITVYLERALEARKAHGDPESASLTADTAASHDLAPPVLESFDAAVTAMVSGVVDVPSGVAVASAFPPSPQLEPEWPVVTAAATDAPEPTVDLWERWQPTSAPAPIAEPVPQPDAERPVWLEPNYTPTAEVDLVAPVEAAPPMAEHALAREWPAQSDVTPIEQDIPIELVAAAESVAPVDIVAPVEAAARTTEPERHEEEPFVPELTRAEHGQASLVARFMARLRPSSPAATAPVGEAGSAREAGSQPVIDALELIGPAEPGPADEPTATEIEVPLELARPAWVEADLTELVEAIAEPVVDPEPIITSDIRHAVPIVELPSLDDARDALSDSRRAPPAPAVQPEAPPPAASRPKAARPASRKRRARPAPKDDWHFFDPEETRFAALLAKLDEITGSDARHS